MTTPSSNVGADASREWQPIESAPKLGEQIIVYGGRYAEPTAVEADGEWWRANKGTLKAIPTHWMPLPASPAREQKAMPALSIKPDKTVYLAAAAPELLEIAERILECGYVSEFIEEERGDHMALVAAIAKARPTPPAGETK